jgi:site-specific DNA-methyltransferase (adenine-specific)
MTYLTSTEKTKSRSNCPERCPRLHSKKDLTKKEVLAAFAGGGIQSSSLGALSKLIKKNFQRGIFSIPESEISKIKGFGKIKAARIAAALSFFEPYYQLHRSPTPLDKNLVEEEAQEYFCDILPDPSLSRQTAISAADLQAVLNQVHEGDCLDVMQSIPSRSIDMILCDLPYGTTQNKWDSVIPLNRLWCEYERILKKNGVIALTSQGVFTAKLILSNETLFKYKIVWEKSKPTNFLNAKKQPLRKHEDICIFYKEQPVYNPQMSRGVAYNKGVRKNQLTGCYGDFKPVEVKSTGERYPLDIFYCKTAESEGPVYHPTQKPVELGRYLIRTFTNPGDIVLDNACGSGSFLVSAALEGRRFIGIEKNKNVHLFKEKSVDYIQVCNDRIAQAKRMSPGSAVAR